MPSEEKTQKPAGVRLPCACKPLGRRVMTSRDKAIEPTLFIDNLEYTGNAVLKANKG